MFHDIAKPRFLSLILCSIQLPKTFYYFLGSSRAQSALLLAAQHTKKWHHDFPNELNSYLYSTIAKVRHYHKTICFLPKCFSDLSRKYTFFKVPTLVNCVALGKAMNTEKGGPFYIQNELIWICNETNEEGHRQVLIPPFSFAYSETISHWSLGCRDSHVRGVRGQPDVPDLGCSSRSCHNVV